MSQTQGQWVIASIYTGEIAPETARYASMDQAGQVLRDLVQQGASLLRPCIYSERRLTVCGRASTKWQRQREDRAHADAALHR